MERLVARTGESCSIAQLDGSDIVYVARVAVPKIIALAVQIGTRFPALPTSLGKVLLAALPADELDARAGRADPLGARRRAGSPDRAERDAELREVRARGWALTDEQLAPGIRSVAAPAAGRRAAGWSRALNVNVHAAETSVDTCSTSTCRCCCRPPGEISADFARCDTVPHCPRPPRRPLDSRVLGHRTSVCDSWRTTVR